MILCTVFDDLARAEMFFQAAILCLHPTGPSMEKHESLRIGIVRKDAHKMYAERFPVFACHICDVVRHFIQLLLMPSPIGV